MECLKVTCATYFLKCILSLSSLRHSLHLPDPQSAPENSELIHCRCVDCRHWAETYCYALVPAVCQPDEWHWCIKYNQLVTN